MAIGNINISACHCHATPNAAISSINYTLEIIEEMGSESKLYSKVVGFRVLHIGMCVKNFLTSKEFVPSRALERRAPRSGATERRYERPERGRSATPKMDPERKSERNSGKGRSARWSARSDFCARPQK